MQKVKDAIQRFGQLRQELNEALLIGGKSMREWNRKFCSLDIDEDLTPIQCHRMGVRLMKLNQLASGMFDAADARYTALEWARIQSYESKYEELVAEYRAEGKRLPAADFFKTMAKAAVKDMEEAALAAKIEREFWKNKINHLTRMRKKLEGVTMNNALTLKVERNVHSVGGTTEEDIFGKEVDEKEDEWE